MRVLEMFELITSVFAIVVFLVIAGSIALYTLRNGSPPMPTSPKVKKELLSIVRRIETHGCIVEMGSGWGTLIFPVAGIFPSVAIHGYENSPIPCLFSKCRKIASSFFPTSKQNCRHLEIHREDFFHAPLTDVGMVICYLSPPAMEKLKTKFEKELHPGSFVVSNTFAVPGWMPEQVIEVPDLYRTKIYVYRLDGIHPQCLGKA